MRWWRTRQRDHDLECELRSDLELEEEEQRERGLSPEEARHAARRSFGNTTLIREQTGEAWGWAPFERYWQDLRYAWRKLRRSPGFAFTAILVLSLGIGASVAIFVFVDAALLKPLPYQSPDRLMSLMSVNQSSAGSVIWALSYADFQDWQQMNKSFSSLEVYTGAAYLMQTESGAEPLMGERVSGGFFRTLGVHPVLGRDFYPGEDRLGGADVALMSYHVWLHRFGRRRNVVGQNVVLDGRAYTIIGVLPRSFSFGPSGSAEFWTPINRLSPHEQSRTFYDFLGLGRLRDGLTVQTAQAEMTHIERALDSQYGITDRNLSARVVPLSEQMVAEVKPILLALFGGAGLLLLIATVNVASLVLARSETRRHEIAVRRALGATPRRLLRQFATESLVLAGFGCAGGVAVATILIRYLVTLVPKDIAAGLPFLENVGLTTHTALFAAAIALLTALLIAGTPTLWLIPQRVREGLSYGDRGSSGRFWRTLGGNLVVVELVIAVVLLTAAGLFGRSLYLLLHVPLGFDPDHLATVQISAPRRSAEQKLTLYRELAQRISGIPGVENSGFTSSVPVEYSWPVDRIEIVGRPSHGEQEVIERHVSSDYLRTLRARLLRGRFFKDSEDNPAVGLAIINRTFARRYFGDEDPIGHKIADDEGGRPSVWEIVGVVDDVREGSQDEEIGPTEYFPINQTRDYYFTVMVRSWQNPGTVLPALVSAIRQLDRGLGVSSESTMTVRIDDTRSALLHRFTAWLVGGFAAMAFTLGVIGLYGVTAYSVSQRTRELGVRMALGAQRGSVYRLVIGEAGWLIALGLTLGLICSVGTSILIRKLLFAVRPWDAATLGGVALLLALASLLASLLPARRAASVDPVEALRRE